MSLRVSERSSRATASPQASGLRPVALELALGTDTLEVQPDMLLITRRRWGVNSRRMLQAECVRAVGYRRSRMQGRSALRVEFVAADGAVRSLKFARGLRPYAAELALAQVEASGMWLAERLEKPWVQAIVYTRKGP